MADPMFDPSTASKLIKAAKDDPVNFAFAVGSGETLLAVDKRKSPEQLMASAKREIGASKACCGTVSFTGSAAMFAAGHPLPGMAKQIEEWFKRGKVTLSCKLGAAHEAEADEDEEDEDVPDDRLFGMEIIRKRIKIARNKPMNFGYGVADDVTLGLHPLKDGKQLSLILKRETGASRVAFGSIVTDGRVVEFHCEQAPLPGMKKRLKSKFKEWKFPLEVKIFGPEGEFDEPDDAAEPEPTPAPTRPQAQAEPEPTPQPQPQANDPAIAALRQDLARLLPTLQAVAKSAPARANVIRDTYQACEKALNAADADRAGAALARLRELAEDQADLTAAAAALHKELEALLVRLKPIVAGDAALGPVIREAYAACDKALKAGDVEGGERELDVLRRLAGVEPEIPAGGSVTDRWKAVRAGWKDAVDAVDHQISMLQAALRASDDEELEAIAEYGMNGLTGNFKVRLMAAMMELDGAADAAGFARVAPKALGLVQGFQKHLEGDVRVAAVDDNPFGVEVSVRRTLGEVLSEMERLLQAA